MAESHSPQGAEFHMRRVFRGFASLLWMSLLAHDRERWVDFG